MQKPRFESLDAFRGIAALTLAIFHFPAIFLGAEHPLLRHSYVLTNLFFALSGFILMSAYGEKMLTALSMARFVQQRFVRLYPLHVLTTLGVLAVPLLTYVTNGLLTSWFEGKGVWGFAYPALTAQELLVHLALLQGFGLLDNLVLNFPAWSMGALFFCSVLFAVSGILGKLRVWLFVAILAASTYVLWALAPAYMGSSHDFGFARAMANFSAGVLAWYIWNRWNPNNLLGGWATTAQAALTLAVLGYVTVLGVNTPWSLLSTGLWMAFIWVFSVDRGHFADVLDHPKLKWLAARSYSLFMNHALLLWIGVQTEEWIRKLGLSSFHQLILGTLALGAYVVALLAMSDWTYRRIEQPLRTRKKIQ